MKTRSEASVGLFSGIGAYLIWGSFPLLIAAASFASPFEVVVWRIVFGFIFAIGMVAITKSFGPIRKLLRDPKKLGWLVAAAVFIYINWQVYVIAVLSGNVIESSLGYFINPLFTVLLAVLVLKEKLRPAQWVALAVGLVAVLILTLDYGRPPYFALLLAFSFGTYSLAKNRLGSKMSALHSFTLESGILLPIAAVQLAIVAMFAPVQLIVGNPQQILILVSFGLLTAVPLILFGAAASRVPLSTIGFLQYLTPTLQFLLGLLYFQEPMPLVRWIGFALVWVGLLLLTADALRTRRKNQKFIENI